MAGRLRALAAAALLVAGAAAVVVGGGALAYSWHAARSFADSAEAVRAERAAVAETPLWVDSTPARGSVPSNPADAAAPTIVPRATLGVQGQTTSLRSAEPADQRQPEPRSRPAEQSAPVLAGPDDLEVAEVEFRFLDPPEPGAHARLAVALRNHAEAPSDRVTLAFDSRWFDSYAVIGAVPEALADHVEENGLRYFDFPGVPPQASLDLELHVAATGEDVDPPIVQVALPNGTLGEARPRTLAPVPRPGPARLISLPRLGIRASVEPTAWEPPPFVAGQILGSSPVSLGNTVLVGHLGGPGGDVFARLSRAQPGDAVVAVSRGLEYRFVVSEALVLPKEDTSPTLPTETPRLTLMTCTGRWNPFTDDYSHRLWVIAEPPELAEATIRNNLERAAREQAEREAAERAEQEAAAAEVPTPEPSEAAALPSAPWLSLFSPPRPAPEQARRRIPLHASPTPVPPRLRFRSPAPAARVPGRVAVEGERIRPIERGHIWLFVRPVEDAVSWYIFRDEIQLDETGAWKIDLDIGGPPGVRHELVVGVLDEETQRGLQDWIEKHPDQPIRALPEGFQEEAKLVVVKE